MAKFKVGDRIKHGIQGVGIIRIIEDYDSGGGIGVEFDNLTDGHILDEKVECKRGHGLWVTVGDFTLIKKGRGRPRKELPPKFLLKYDLDKDPIEEFATLKEVKTRIKELVKDESLRRDSIVVYEIKKKTKVELEAVTKIKGL